MQDRVNRLGSVGALFATAIVTGAIAAVITAAFIWCYEHGIDFVWGDVPDALGVDPYGSWFTIAVPVVGGLLVGLVHLWIGDHPQAMEVALETWKSGERLAPSIAPKTMLAAAVILILGGPVGFEAAIVGVAGGMAAWSAVRIRSVGSLVRQVWGAERIDMLPEQFAKSPYWVAGITSLVAYRWMPFGGIDMGFRFDRFDGEWAVGDAATAFVTAVLVTVPTLLALVVIQRCERSTRYERSPIVYGMVGGLLFAILALGNEIVLFSGQMQFQQLPFESDGALLYVTVAKFAALLIAVSTGWRGGPIFPLYTSIGAFAIVAADVVGATTDIVQVAALAAVSTVLVKGNVPLALVLTLYVVPISYGFVMVIGSVAAVVVLALLRTSGVIPEPDEPEPA
ncbi:chloride channel protein [Ilumatobacter fluminis]|uniref:chloride channel protein n=1 Tax=Ilumatobacter fluminis TaxID=467091 RepID=UPI00105B57EE|nr:chloride channel protein [Ilumatobacter fluminis]